MYNEKIFKLGSDAMSCALPRLAIVIPCYNESAVLTHTLNTLHNYLRHLIDTNKIAADSFLYCVDDGSDDDTWQIISHWHKQFSQQIKGLKLAKNVGHQNALLAGLLGVKNKMDCVISIDADLQDDVTAIDAMLDQFKLGYDIVCGIRKSRNKDTLFKRLSALAFYQIMKKSGSDILLNHADFRLLSHRVVLTLSKFKERNLFLRGIIPLMGYRVSQIFYDRVNRVAGESKYTLRKMLSLAWDGITSFSHIPLSLILIFGVMSFLLSILMMLWVVFAKFFATTVPGWASIMIPICLMGGVQLLSVGVIGEYVAKIYIEVKKRPRFIKDMELS